MTEDRRVHSSSHQLTVHGNRLTQIPVRVFVGRLVSPLVPRGRLRDGNERTALPTVDIRGLGVIQLESCVGLEIVANGRAPRRIVVANTAGKRLILRTPGQEM
jgi:hypothetical protein